MPLSFAVRRKHLTAQQYFEHQILYDFIVELSRKVRCHGPVKRSLRDWSVRALSFYFFWTDELNLTMLSQTIFPFTQKSMMNF